MAKIRQNDCLQNTENLSRQCWVCVCNVSLKVVNDVITFSWREQYTFRWGDNDICLVLDQRT